MNEFFKLAEKEHQQLAELKGKYQLQRRELDQVWSMLFSTFDLLELAINSKVDWSYDQETETLYPRLEPGAEKLIRSEDKINLDFLKAEFVVNQLERDLVRAIEFEENAQGTSKWTENLRQDIESAQAILPQQKALLKQWRKKGITNIEPLRLEK